MIAINLNKLKISLAQIKAVRKRVDDSADGQFRQKLYWLAQQAVLVSPQFTGDFASNWNLAVDGNMPVYKPLPGKYSNLVTSRVEDNGRGKYGTSAHQAGDPQAIGVAMQRIAGQLKGVTRKSHVHLVNATELSTDGTHMSGPDGTVKLRAVNVIPGNVRIETYLRARVQEMA